VNSDVLVYDAVRTPFGKYGGALAGSRPDDLAALVVQTLVGRAPGLDPARVDEIVLGNANGAGEDNRNIARMAGLLAGLPVSVPATTVNRLCGSSLGWAWRRWRASPGAVPPRTTRGSSGSPPVEAANIALKRAGIGWGNVGVVELNEAFAAQAIACIKAWDIDPAIVNSHGGAIAIGHPLGASGMRILGTLARSLLQAGERWGVAAICIGVGQGLAVVLENARSCS